MRLKFEQSPQRTDMGLGVGRFAILFQHQRQPSTLPLNHSQTGPHWLQIACSV